MSTITSDMTESVVNLAIQLLGEMILTLEPLWGVSSKARQENQFDKIEKEMNLDYHGFFEEAFKHAKTGNYFVAYKIFQAVHEKNQHLGEKRFLFCVMWSGIQCGYYLRGKPGQHILAKTQETINNVLNTEQETQKTVNERLKQIADKISESTSAPRDTAGDVTPAIPTAPLIAEQKQLKKELVNSKIRASYLHYLKSLSFGLCVNPSEKNIPDYLAIESQVAELSTAQETLKKCVEILNGITPPEAFGSFRNSMNRRREKLDEMQAFFFGRSWARAPFRNTQLGDRIHNPFRR